MSNKNIIVCPSCGKEHSIFVDTCPDCGEPNSVVHPSIQKLQSGEFEGSNEFTFEYDKNKVWGEKTKGKFGFWLWVVTIIEAGFLSAPIVLAFPLILLAVYWVNKNWFFKSFMHYDWFEADVKTGSWESSDDEFFKGVKTALT